MSTPVERSSVQATDQDAVGAENSASENLEARISRFERLGVKIFCAANCFVSFGNLSARFEPGAKSMAALEASFCDSIPFQAELKVVHDTRNDPQLAVHRLVAGPPYIRFYAAYPLFDSAQKVIGNVSIVDFQPHVFDEQDGVLLADLALLVEREMTLMTMYQTQLDLIKQNRNLKRDSMIDPALGTWNKAAIVRSMQIEMQRCNKSEKPLSLIFISWDQNLTVRDSFGMAMADILMLKVVSRIRSCIRPFDALGRFGNDVFLVVLPGASHLVVTAVAERIRLAILSHPESIDDTPIPMSITAGVASSDIFTDADPEFLLNQAEKALLTARNAGNNRIAKAMPSQTDIII